MREEKWRGAGEIGGTSENSVKLDELHHDTRKQIAQLIAESNAHLDGSLGRPAMDLEYRTA